MLVVVLNDQVVGRVSDLLVLEGEELVTRMLSVDDRLALLDLINDVLHSRILLLSQRDFLPARLRRIIRVRVGLWRGMRLASMAGNLRHVFRHFRRSAECELCFLGLLFNPLEPQVFVHGPLSLEDLLLERLVVVQVVLLLVQSLEDGRVELALLFELSGFDAIHLLLRDT